MAMHPKGEIFATGQVASVKGIKNKKNIKKYAIKTIKI